MNEQHPANPPPTIKPGDILYLIFRHKWKILIISGLGIIATFLVPFFAPRMYQSEAKLLIKYVLESKSARQIASNNDSQVQRVDAQGESIINTELQVLSSLDLARDVARVMTPGRILANSGGGTNLEAAAALIRANIQTEVPKGSSVIRITFQSPDRTLVQPVLQQIIASYLKKHADVHSGGGGLDNYLLTQTTALHDSLVQTEGRLLDAKQKANIISLDDSKKTYADQMAKIRQEILDAQAELTERQTQAAELQKLLHLNAAAGTNQVALSNSVPVPPAKVTEYRGVCRLLESLRKTEDDLLTQFTPESKRVKDVEAEIATHEKRQQQLEEENPGLLSVRPSEPAGTGRDPAANAKAELVSATAQVVALQAKIDQLNQQWTNTMAEASKLGSEEPAIAELQRQLALDEARYKYFYDNWQQSQADTQLGPGSISNITSIQDPSPPYLAASKMLKTMALILFGSIGVALALAFAVEFYLDPCLKRPAEVEAKLGVPLFLSIPLFRQNGHSHSLNSGKKVPLLAESNQEKPPGNGEPHLAKQESNGVEESLALARESTGESGVARWDSEHPMHPFSDALRDRLISFFEIKNMTHKPKLVALTSCKEGSGVSTVAAGLAASLSETGDGNVLLVDMNQQEGSAQQFYRGNPACLDEALQADTRDHALVQDNLYVVAESSTGDNLPRALPRRFKNIVPKLKASDFDYIIFDLPPVNQISMTPRLARFMDVILMVIESETTDKEVLKKGITLLHESQKNIGTVLNKRRSYVPKSLQQEF